MALFGKREKLAHEYTMQNERKYHTHWDEKNEAGDNWIRGFRNRHSASVT